MVTFNSNMMYGKLVNTDLKSIERVKLLIVNQPVDINFYVNALFHSSNIKNKNKKEFEMLTQ